MNYVDSFARFLFTTEGGHFLLAYAGCTIVGTMPAPTARSGTMYQWAFSCLNAFAANWMRARGPRVENSPNFQDALNKLPGPVDKPVVVVEAPKP